MYKNVLGNNGQKIHMPIGAVGTIFCAI